MSRNERTQRISPTGSDGFIRRQTSLIVAGVILIQPDFDGSQFVLRQIVRIVAHPLNDPVTMNASPRAASGQRSCGVHQSFESRR